jgi:uncharacterized membrane protein YdjX (TVP38/TMEM64 family)
MKVHDLNEHLTPKIPDAHKALLKSNITISKVILIVAVISAIIGFFTMGFDSYLSFETLRNNRGKLLDWYNHHYLITMVLFILTYTLVVALSLPGAIWMTLVGGFIFGTLQGTVLAVVSATLGAFIVFILVQFCLVDFFRAKTGKAVEKMEAGFKSNALSYLIFLRLVPVFPFWLVNLVPAFLRLPVRTFIIGTSIGIIPGTALFCWVGSGLGVVLDTGDALDPLEILLRPEVIGPIIGLGILSLIPIIYKNITNNSS